jgi:DNA-binding transcriptional ArsR family regulator
VAEAKRIGPALLTAKEALELRQLFKVLASDVRLRLLQALVRNGELCVTSLARVVRASPQAVSNQLQRLVDRDIVRPRRQGNLIYYRIVNACVTDLLDRGICLVRRECPDVSS